MENQPQEIVVWEQEEEKRPGLKSFVKNHRKWKTLCFCFFLLLSLYVSSCAYILYYARKETDLSLQYFNSTSPDIIAIFTGDKGRIPYGIQKALEYNKTQVFISGVNNQTSLHTLLKSLKKEILAQLETRVETIPFLEVDYSAQNTIENVVSTLQYLENKRESSEVLIISSDYHITRIKLILDKVKDPHDHHRYHFLGIENNYFQWKTLKKLSLEIFKSIRAYIYLLFWDGPEDYWEKWERGEKDGPVGEAYFPPLPTPSPASAP